MYIDKRTIYIIMGILIITGLARFFSSTGELLDLLYTIPGLLIAITFHEFAHAFVADKLGDDTPRNQGRLTLNPLAHLDPIGTIMLLFVKFGWGKPVQVNPRNYDRRMSMEKADAIVSLAGPLMNFILAVFFTIILCLLSKFSSLEFYLSEKAGILFSILNGIIYINIGLGIFNLIPVPPLDGSKIIKPILPQNIRNWFEDYSQIFEMVFVGLWIFGALERVISPIVFNTYCGLIGVFSWLFKL